MYQKRAIKNDTADLIEYVENSQNKGQTGGAQDHTKEKGVAHFPGLMYPEEGSQLFLGPKPIKVILIREILGRKKGPKDFLKSMQNKLGQGARIDHKLKKIISKKYPTAEVFASFLTVGENLIPELEKLTKENKIPMLTLRKKKKAFLNKKASELKAFKTAAVGESIGEKLGNKIFALETYLQTLDGRIYHRYPIIEQRSIVDEMQNILEKMKEMVKRLKQFDIAIDVSDLEDLESSDEHEVE